jgi:hypothetical protein
MQAYLFFLKMCYYYCMLNENSPAQTSGEQVFSIIEETQIELQQLRGLRNQHESDEREAQIIQERMGRALLSGKQKLLALAENIHDPLILARIETAEKEMEKELVEIEIEWLEKMAYDLRVRTSPKKIKLEDNIARIKRGDFLIALTDCVSALREEKLLLEETHSINSGHEENKKRLNEVDGQLKKLERQFGEIKDLEK